MKNLIISSDNILGLFEFVKVCANGEIKIESFSQKGSFNNVRYYLETTPFMISLITINRRIAEVRESGFDIVLENLDMNLPR